MKVHQKESGARRCSVRLSRAATELSKNDAYTLLIHTIPYTLVRITKQVTHFTYCIMSFLLFKNYIDRENMDVRAGLLSLSTADIGAGSFSVARVYLVYDV